MTSQTRLYRARVRDAMRASAGAVTADASCRDAVARLREGPDTCIIIADSEGKPAGILTEQDVVRRIAFQVDPGQPVGEVMTAPVQTIGADEFLFHAVAAMRRLNIRHLAATDAHGRLVGVLRLKDALFETDRALMEEIDALSSDGGIKGLAALKRALPELAGGLLDDGVPVPEIQALLTEVNNDVYRRVTDLTLDVMAEASEGSPPREFSVIVMGSGGRGENFIYPDQDNGLILRDASDGQGPETDAWFIEFSERLTAALDEVGFALCKGNVMATNPVWRKSIGEWREQFSTWVAKGTAQTMRLCDIIFDFRSVWGPTDLAQALRRHISATVAHNRSFLRELTAESESAGVALGFFDRFILVHDDEIHKGTINLKQSGSLPLIEAVRIVALREGIEALSTLGRIEALADSGYLDRDEEDYLAGAYQHLSALILRHQVEAAREGREVSYFVAPDRLTRREKDMLVDAFKAIRRFRDRVRAELTGDIF